MCEHDAASVWRRLRGLWRPPYIRRGLPYLTGRSRLFSSNSPRDSPRPALHRCGLCILRRPSAHTSTVSGVREVACDRWAANAHVTYRVSPDLPDERPCCERAVMGTVMGGSTARTSLMKDPLRQEQTSLMKDPLRQEQAPSTRRRPSLSEIAPCAAARRSRESTCAAHTSLQGRLHGHWQSVPLRGTQRHSVAPRGYQPAPLSCHSAPNHTCD